MFKLMSAKGHTVTHLSDANFCGEETLSEIIYIHYRAA